jgi:hypothetical protein
MPGLRPQMTYLYDLCMEQMTNDTDLSICCGVFTTYMQVGEDENGETVWGLCCKACCAELE